MVCFLLANRTTNLRKGMSKDERKKMVKNCKVCSKEFESHMVEGVRFAGMQIAEDHFRPYCDTCFEIIKEVNWRGSHRKEPNLKDLKVELKKRIKDLEREVKEKINRLQELLTAVENLET